jgi:hypothetical protein
MGIISLQNPQIGQPDTTEDVKVQNNFTTLQTVINGNIDDTNLSSPNNGVRRLLLQSAGAVNGGTAAGDYVFYGTGGLYSSGLTGQSGIVPIWPGDSGLSSQPKDFTVANKTAFGRVRGCITTNGTSPGVTITLGLYLLTALGGTSATIVYTFETAVAGSTVGLSGGAGLIPLGESGQFAMPTAVGGYMLGVNVSGTTAAASYTGVSLQLYGYNA